MSQVTLFKYQALGNDYLVLDLPGPLDDLVALLPTLCDRHRGLGCDGLLAFDPMAMTVRIFNPDRSEAQKSGNGLRITAAHAVLEHGAKDAFDLRTADRANGARVLARNGAEIVIELDIGRPSFRAADLPASFDDEPEHVNLDTPAGRVEAVLVSMGNPHCVVFGQAVTRERCLELGPHLEVHPAFPERTNVQLCEAMDRARVRAEIWERGTGNTLASGTSASAVAAACMRRGLVDEQVTVVMPGGELAVRRESMATWCSQVRRGASTGRRSSFPTSPDRAAAAQRGTSKISTGQRRFARSRRPADGRSRRAESCEAPVGPRAAGRRRRRRRLARQSRP